MDLGEMPGYRLAVAGQYEGAYAAHTADAARARRAALAPYVDRVLEALDLPDDGWLLDVGSGDGLLALSVARLRPRMQVVGIDLATSAVDLARRLAREDRLTNVVFEEADAESPPEGSYDRIAAMSAFNLLPDKRAALAAWRRVAAPGARVVIADGLAARGPGTLGSGAASHAALLLAARATRWRELHREDLTAVVAKLHAARVWPWPEYVRDGIRYGLVTLG